MMWFALSLHAAVLFPEWFGYQVTDSPDLAVRVLGNFVLAAAMLIMLGCVVAWYRLFFRGLRKISDKEIEQLKSRREAAEQSNEST